MVSYQKIARKGSHRPLFLLFLSVVGIGAVAWTSAILLLRDLSPLPRGVGDVCSELHACDTFQTSPLKPRIVCPNFFVVLTERGGLGHRVSAIVYALVAANGSGAALALDDAFWAEDRVLNAGNRSSVAFFRELFDLRSFISASELGLLLKDSEITRASPTRSWGELEIVRSLSVDEAQIAAASGCGRAISMRTGHATGCSDRQTGKPCYCTYDSRNIGAFEATRSFFRALYLRGKVSTGALRFFSTPSAGTLNVVWHVRNGDLFLRPDRDFWAFLVQSVREGTKSFQTQHYIMCENNLEINGPFGFLFAIPNFSFEVLSHLPDTAAIRHMEAADVLVNTGSSFATTAALVAPQDQVHVYCAPKEGGDIATAVQRLSGSIAVPQSGEILQNGIEEMKRLIKKRSNRISDK